jgi:hypothetical protein
MNALLRRTGTALARYLSRPIASYRPLATSSLEALDAALQPGDVLLVEGDTRIATAIKYVTQSTWSHAALCLGRGAVAGMDPQVNLLIEADLVEGIRVVPLETYARHHTRICRPQGLAPADIQVITGRALARLGHRYDLKNVIDLLRYLLPTPPVPSRLRRRMLVLGSGQPTRAICSTFIAQLFQDVRYPILPTVERRPTGECNTCYDEVHSIRHHSLYAPRDFDVSPYFRIVKPTLEIGFDHRKMRWEGAGAEVAVAA